ncbi:hypothetical protein [Glycomyces tenuis]|uniref:hypothetical protein n=1 Tax=Glycomyces tenuis TaxID=58116 RepID=UPI000A4A8BD2|nr:hypothetical protein [Glycomyces tenuis]
MRNRTRAATVSDSRNRIAIAAGAVEIHPQPTERAVKARFAAAMHLVAERIGVQVDE